jgi:hypothetical protein
MLAHPKYDFYDFSHAVRHLTDTIQWVNGSPAHIRELSLRDEDRPYIVYYNNLRDYDVHGYVNTPVRHVYLTPETVPLTPVELGFVTMIDPSDTWEPYVFCASRLPNRISKWGLTRSNYNTSSVSAHGRRRVGSHSMITRCLGATIENRFPSFDEAKRLLENYSPLAEIAFSRRFAINGLGDLFYAKQVGPIGTAGRTTCTLDPYFRYLYQQLELDGAKCTTH